MTILEMIASRGVLAINAALIDRMHDVVHDWQGNCGGGRREFKCLLGIFTSAG